MQCLSWETRRLARSPLLRWERGSEKGSSAALGGASGSWRGEEVNARDASCPRQSPGLEMIRGNRAPRLPKQPKGLGNCCISPSLVCYHLCTEKSRLCGTTTRWRTARGGSCSFGTCCRIFRPEFLSFHTGSWHTRARTGAHRQGGIETASHSFLVPQKG